MARRKPGDAIEKLIADTLAMEAEAAQDAGALGFMARALVQATLPHKKVQGAEFTRRNGAYTLTLLARGEDATAALTCFQQLAAERFGD